MINYRFMRIAGVLLCLTLSLTNEAKDVKDTLYSSTGDRIILDYTIQQAGGQTTLRFNGVQKKLGQENQRKYRKLDEVAVVIFDRTGSYNDVKFEGLTPSTFMLPAGVQYNYSSDGYYLLQDNPQMTFTCSGEEHLSIPVFLAHYEKKRHYKVFSQCDPLTFSTKVSGGARKGRSSAHQGGSGDDRAANADEIITTEELTDEGLTPIDDAMITIASVNNALKGVTKLPFPEDLTFQANHLRELRSKISDMDMLQEINGVLANYDKKKAELEESAANEQQAAAAAAQQAAQEQAAAQQARQDSIQAAQEQKAADEKKDMMWLIGGIAGIGMLLMFGKQIFQNIKNNKMQKMMMDNINKAQRQAMGQVKIPGMENNPLGQEINQQIKSNAQKGMAQQTAAAQEKLQAMKQGIGGSQPGVSGAPETAGAGAIGAAGGFAFPGAAGAAQQPIGAQPVQTAQPTQTAQPVQPTQPATPGKRPLRTASQVRAAAGVTGPTTITPGGQRSSLNDAIPTKYKRWKKPGKSGDSSAT